MNEDPSRRRLGRGLAALIGEIDRPAPAEEAKVAADRNVPIEFLSPNPRNPRRNFAEAELGDLAQSIREHGIVQPVVVRPSAKPAATRSSPASAVARRAAGRADANPGHRARRQRPRRPRAGDRRERPAHRPQSGRGSARLPAAARRTRIHAGRSRADHRQEPQPRRQHAAAAEAAGPGARHGRRRLALGWSCATLVNAEDPTGLARRIIEGGLSVRQAESMAQQPAENDNGPRSPQQRTARMPTPWRWRKCCPTRQG